MKTARTLVIVLILIAPFIGTLIWFTGSGLLEGIGFGYYRDFHIAQEQIEKSACAESIEYARHEDLTLESFHFKIHTKSGWVVRLWFHRGMDVREACSKPPGLLVRAPHNWQSLSQGYSISELSARLAEKGITVINVNDFLCNIDELAPMFRANYNNQDIPRITYKDADFNRYLSIEILEEGRGSEFQYSRIR